MAKIQYVHFAPFKQYRLELIEQANEIIDVYRRQGYTLTLRQLYYQFVSRDLLPNNMRSYKMLGNAVNDGRLAGMIDWLAIEDRTRNLVTIDTWASPEAIIRAARNSYRIDKWADQEMRMEVWVEKDALSGVFDRVCDELEVPLFACRGYASQSEMWSAAMRFADYRRKKQEPVILHFGDHDPSGMDMTRDIVSRLEIFMGGMEVKRLALNMSQIEQYNPPPNPAKTSDTRFRDYEEQFGDESFELDALEPSVLVELTRRAVLDMRDNKKWVEAQNREFEEKELLEKAEDNWESLALLLKGNDENNLEWLAQEYGPEESDEEEDDEGDDLDTESED